VILDKRPTGTRYEGEPSKGRINLRLETIGQKTGEREGVKQTTARRARRRAHAGELQHGTGQQYRAHGVVRIPGSYSTAQCATSTPATHMPQHGTHGTVRTPRNYNTAQCPGDTHSTARMKHGAHQGATARQGAHR
jgi:hypothetical protein